MLDTSIALGVRPMQIDSPVNQLAGILQLQGAQSTNQLNQLKMAALQRQDDRQNQLLALTRGWAPGTTDQDRITSLRNNGFFDEGDKIDTAVQNRTKITADAAKANAEAQAKQVEAAGKRLDMAGQVFGFVNKNPTLENAHAALDYLGSNGIYTPEQVAQYKEQVAQNPQGIAQLADMAYRSALSAKDQLPKIENVALGDRTVTQSVDPVSGKVTQVASQAIGQSADNKATNAAHIAGIAMQQKGENLRAGFDASGNPTGDMETTARAIASGQLPPPSGMALTSPKNQRILARVMEINPNYDFTDITAKKKAASDFTSGSLGGMMRSNFTASEHLDQLGQLADALNNRDTQLLNKVGNLYASQTGSPAPTNFDAVKQVVGAEVMKAIVANGGGVGEREELSRVLSSAQSPAQLKGVISNYRNLMNAQYQNLLAQRRAAGLSDSTLPQYNQSGSGSVALPNAAAIDAEIARRQRGGNQ